MTTRSAVLNSLQIGKEDFVVEVGAGHQPFYRTDLIIDKYPFDNLHRSLDLVHSAPVVIGDANHLPIHDGGCDLLFASHLIEHLPEPGRFLSEVKRSAKRVYLEFPSRKLELLFGWSFHQWLVEVKGAHLTFYRNDIPQLFGDLFHRNYDLSLDAWLLARHHDFNGSVACASRDLTWEFAEEGALAHVIATSAHGPAKVNAAPHTPVEYTWMQVVSLLAQRALPPRAFERVVNLRRRRRTGAPRAITPAMLAHLMCLQCKSGSLAFVNGNQVGCTSCGAVFEQKNGLLDLDVVADAVVTSNDNVTVVLPLLETKTAPAGRSQPTRTAYAARALLEIERDRMTARRSYDEPRESESERIEEPHNGGGEVSGWQG
jgi:hypothetical protein